MIHYTCDGCKKNLNSNDDIRYKVKIETYIANDLDDDTLDSECLENEDFVMDEDEDENICDELDEIEYNTFEFDLCQPCYKSYQKNPVSIKTFQYKRFSEN